MKRTKEKEAKRNIRNRLSKVVDTAAHVEIGGQPQTTGVDHNYHNRLDNPSGYPQSPQPDGYGFMQFL